MHAFAVSTEPAFGEGVETRLAGVLYLLNLLKAVDVEGTLERWREEGALGTWALLEVLGRTLLSEAEGDIHDSLWAALAMLDGREPDAPIDGGAAGGNSVVLPASWVLELTESTEVWQWGLRGGRLAIWSDAGVPVAELPHDPAERPSRQAGALLASLGIVSEAAGPTRAAGSPNRLRRRPFDAAPFAEFDGCLAAGIPEPLRPWLRVVVPFLRHRLRLALGETPLEEVLRCGGRLHITSSHVDLVSPLAAVSLATRRAGLDRDPGWLPRAGRVVLFHFDGAPYRFS